MQSKQQKRLEYEAKESGREEGRKEEKFNTAKNLLILFLKQLVFQ